MFESWRFFDEHSDTQDKNTTVTNSVLHNNLAIIVVVVVSRSKQSGVEELGPCVCKCEMFFFYYYFYSYFFKKTNQDKSLDVWNPSILYCILETYTRNAQGYTMKTRDCFNSATGYNYPH